MDRTCSYFKSTIGQKTLVAITGLSLSIFCITHMAGNLLLLEGAQAYNRYSYAIITNPLLPVAEIGLLVMFFLHVGLALKLNYQNKMAKGMRSAPAHHKGSSFAAKTMVYSGLLLFVFIGLHLITFKYGPHYSVTYEGVEMRDLYRLVVEKFKEPVYLAYYIFSMVILGLHLSHGLKGSLQSLGFFSSRHKTVATISCAVAIIIAVGFVVQPIYLFFFGVNG